MEARETKRDSRPRRSGLLRRVQRHDGIRRHNVRPHAFGGGPARDTRREGALKRFLDLRRG